MKDNYLDDILKMSYKNKDKFKLNDNILKYVKDNDYILHIIKNKSLIGIMVYFKMDQIYKKFIDKGDDYYREFNIFYTNKYNELNKNYNIKNDNLILKFLDKNTRYFKIKKINKIINSNEK